MLMLQQLSTITTPPASTKRSISGKVNETVKMPVDVMGQVFTRSSVWRSLARVEAGVVDSGYAEALGGALLIANGQGIIASKNTRLPQSISWNDRRDEWL